MPPASPPCGNLLLDALRAEDRALLLPHLEPVECRRGEVLFEVGQDVEMISFPCGATVTTLVVTMRDGRSAETATIGREGAIGGVVSQGYLPAFSRAVVQIGGPVLRLEAARLQAVKRTSPLMRNLFTRYSDCLLAQVLQSVACNALHPIEQRCARWLLTLQDRLDTDTLPITQEMLAERLGVQRTYLTRVLKMLQQQGLIAVGRGRITIRDRADMEKASCECHAVVKRHFEEVLGAVYSPSGALVAVSPASEEPAVRHVG
ncbi:Crp/Fnr family transcriptional regulator [uncultured Methylobacterium sp.]|jgi:DNA-binding MarR family transcriptional regulator|uniref:Crp/Fnr family transcriptional regulator n=1 Tax=uncultured Methylobacterium sp. TaxID=157278 RepID=UPI00260C0B42|nr:Crp/Fnr family transcriptional regulator [uncultured Methylobacterium sp.]